MFYVYQWYNTDTQEIFYVGKGTKDRYKDMTHRNHLFLEYKQNNPVDVEILAYFEDEKEALLFEHLKITLLKQQGQCFCNLDNGGTGGLNFIWTEEMRLDKSLHNPMKEEKQRERMREKNPMYNPEARDKMIKTKTLTVLFGEEGNLEETTVSELAKRFEVSSSTVYAWIKKGRTSQGTPCYYKNPLTKKKVNSKPVLIDGQYFPSCSKASKFLGETHSNGLIRALKNGYTEYRGHKCEYANQQPSSTNPNNSSTEGSTTNG